MPSTDIAIGQWSTTETRTAALWLFSKKPDWIAWGKITRSVWVWTDRNTSEKDRSRSARADLVARIEDETYCGADKTLSNKLLEHAIDRIEFLELADWLLSEHIPLSGYGVTSGYVQRITAGGKVCL